MMLGARHELLGKGLGRRLPWVSILTLLAVASFTAAGAGEDPQKELRLPADFAIVGTDGSPGTVVFRHTTHAPLTGNSCVTCHPQPFPILHPLGKVAHADMNAGRSCGTCHDGKSAFGTADGASCRECHGGRETDPPAADPAPRGASPAAAVPAGRAPAAPRKGPGRNGPRDVTFKAGADSPGPVTFRHAAHLAGGTQCGACHPKPFAMKAGQTPLVKDAMLKGGTCGACHDGKRAFAVDDGAACERCHAAEGPHR